MRVYEKNLLLVEYFLILINLVLENEIIAFSMLLGKELYFIV